LRNLNFIAMAHSPVASPCIGVCRMDDATGWCEGCLRTIDEIVAWGGTSDAHRREVLGQLSARRVRWRALLASRRAGVPPAEAAGPAPANPATPAP